MNEIPPEQTNCWNEYQEQSGENCGVAPTNSKNGEQPQEETPSVNGGDGRDERGRFTKGNRGGTGNPFARQTAALRAALCDAVTEEDIGEVARKLVEKAKAGDLAAARLLLSYTVGKPTAAENPDTLDSKEWQQYQQGAVLPDVFWKIVNSLTPDKASALLQVMAPLLMQQMAQQIKNQGQDEEVMDGDADNEQSEEELDGEEMTAAPPANGTGEANMERRAQPGRAKTRKTATDTPQSPRPEAHAARVERPHTTSGDRKGGSPSPHGDNGWQDWDEGGLMGHEPSKAKCIPSVNGVGGGRD